MIALGRVGEEQSRGPHERPRELPEPLFDHNFPAVIVAIYLIIRAGVSLFLGVVSHGGKASESLFRVE